MMNSPNEPSTILPPNRTSSHAKDEVGRFNLLGHDVRAALSDVLGGLRLIDPQGLDAAAKLQLERVRAAGEGLARLLEEAASFMPDEEAAGPVALRTSRLLNDLEMRWAGRAQEKGLALQICISADAPRRVLVDRVALDRALSNVLSNAIKCTDHGEIRLAVSRGPQSTLCFTLCDQGPGFSKEMMARLWQPHARGAESPNEGQGLGLHICKQMVDRLNGHVEIANLARGALVTIEVPVTELADGVETALPDLRGKRVLIAEDSETNQAILTQMLREMGAQVTVAGDGIEALALLAKTLALEAPAPGFDLALIDIEMPRLSGIEVIRTLRETAQMRGARVPVIAVTAYVLRSNREAIFAAGADAILPKPLENIYVTGAAILSAQNALPQSTDEIAAQSDLPQIDAARFERTLTAANAGTDGRGARELLRRLISDLSACERGLVVALAASDAPKIRAETHILLAVAGAVGALRLSALAIRLNHLAHQTETDPANPTAESLANPDLDDLGRNILIQIDLLIQHSVRASARYYPALIAPPEDFQ